MKRREFLALLGGAAVAWPLQGRAQQSRKLPRIGVLWHAGNEVEEAKYLAALRQGFNDLGYVEGKTYVLENRFAAEKYERFNSLAAELVAAKVDVLVAITPEAALAAQHATATIPVVFAVVGNPVGAKLVDSLARPGRNITGLSNVMIDLSGKRLELFKDAIPTLSHVILLVNPNAYRIQVATELHRSAAAALGLMVQEIATPDPNSIESAFSAIADRTSGLFIVPDSMLFNERKHIAELALAHRLPSMAFNAEMVEAGLLMSYGASFLVQFRQVAVYVDKILKGAKPADLPVEQPVQFELIINSKTAKALHLDIPPSLLARADEVIE
jgi:putative tryptophan/tyrosine transport system substrate-binding protein